MKKQFRIFAFLGMLALAGGLLFASCSKDDDDSPAASTTTNNGGNSGQNDNGNNDGNNNQGGNQGDNNGNGGNNQGGNSGDNGNGGNNQGGNSGDNGNGNNNGGDNGNGGNNQGGNGDDNGDNGNGGNNGGTEQGGGSGLEESDAITVMFNNVYKPMKYVFGGWALDNDGNPFIYIQTAADVIDDTVAVFPIFEMQYILDSGSWAIDYINYYEDENHCDELEDADWYAYGFISNPWEDFSLDAVGTSTTYKLNANMDLQMKNWYEQAIQRSENPSTATMKVIFSDLMIYYQGDSKGNKRLRK